MHTDVYVKCSLYLSDFTQDCNYLTLVTLPPMSNFMNRRLQRPSHIRTNKRSHCNRRSVKTLMLMGCVRSQRTCTYRCEDGGVCCWRSDSGRCTHDRLLSRSHCRRALQCSLAAVGPAGGRVEMSVMAGEDAAPHAQSKQVSHYRR